MAGGGIVASGILLIVAGLIVPGIGAQETLVEAGGYQVTQTTYPYASLGQMLLIVGVILVPVGFIAMAASASSKRRQEREQRQERQQLYDLVAHTATPAYAPPLPVVPQVETVHQTVSNPEFRSFCPSCGQRLNSEFCPSDGTKAKPLGGGTS